MRTSHGRHGGNNGRNDKLEAEQAKQPGLGESLSGGRDQDEAQGHTSGKD